MSVTQDMKASRHRVAQTPEYKWLHLLSFCSKLQSIGTRFLCVLIRGGRIMTCWICDVGLPIFRQLGDRLSFIYVNGNVMFPIYFSLEVVKTTISVATRDGKLFLTTWCWYWAHKSRAISILLTANSVWVICREPRHVILIMAIWDAQFVRKDGLCQKKVTYLSGVDALPVVYLRPGPSNMMSLEISDLISLS